MSRTQDLVVARLRIHASRWDGRASGAAPGWASTADTSAQPDGLRAAAASHGRPPPAAASGPGLRVLIVVVVVALALGVWMLVRAWPRQLDAVAGADGAGARIDGAEGSAGGAPGWPPSPLAPAGAAPERADSSDPAAPAPSSPSLVVHVAGEVRDPGVVVLPPGSRVGDAVAAAGGLRRGGSLGPANLARVLADGERIEIGAGVAPEQASAPSADPGGAAVPVDLNSATAEQLDALPGIGPVTAAKILAWRSEHGRFSVVDELAEVPGIGPRTLEELRPHVRI